MIWWTNLPLGVLGFLLVDRRSELAARLHRLHGRSVALLPLLLAGLVIGVVLRYQRYLPVLVQHGAYTALQTHVLSPVLFLTSVIAFVALVRQTRGRSLLQLALCVNAFTMLLGLATIAASRNRYSVGWYLEFLDLLVSSTVMLAVLLAEVHVLYADAVQSKKRQQQLLATEVALRQSEARFRHLVEMSDDSIFQTDEAFRFTDVNQQLVDFLGRDVDELLGRCVSDFVEESAQARVWAAQQQRLEAASDGNNWLVRYDLPCVRPDGTCWWASVSAISIFDEAGRFAGMWGMASDITARKAAEAALAAERDRLQRILNVLPEAVVVYDADARARMMNPLAETLFGRGNLGMKRPGFQTTVTLPDGTPLPLERLPSMRALAGETSRAERVVVQHRTSGASVTTLTSAAPLRDAAGAITGAVAVMQDISALVALERQRDRMLSMVAHDLRNPLTGISCISEVLQPEVEQHVDEAARQGFAESLRHIASAAGRMVTQINDLLDHTRAQAGRPIVLALARADIVELVRGVIEEHQHATSRHHLELQCAEEHILAQIDRRRLERALANLLVNAIKYSPQGGPVVVTVARTVGSDGPSLCIEVADNGIGIPAADLPHMFEQYYRASNVQATIPGNGIGLAGVRHIAQCHGGTATLDQCGGHGHDCHDPLAAAAGGIGSPACRELAPHGSSTHTQYACVF